MGPCSADRPSSSVIPPGPACDFSLMVNDRFPPKSVHVRNAAKWKRIFVTQSGSLRIDSNAADARSFKLSENLTRIRVEYGQKARGAANRAFKPPC
jgi:hypothetical protein